MLHTSFVKLLQMLISLSTTWVTYPLSAHSPTAPVEWPRPLWFTEMGWNISPGLLRKRLRKKILNTSPEEVSTTRSWSLRLLDRSRRARLGCERRNVKQFPSAGDWANKLAFVAAWAASRSNCRIITDYIALCNLIPKWLRDIFFFLVCQISGNAASDT